MNFSNTVFAVLVAIILYMVFIKKKVAALASAGNPNYPQGQLIASIGPQGPNDGSNNPDGSGHTIYPVTGSSGVSQIYGRRGYTYTSGPMPGGVQVQSPVY